MDRPRNCAAAAAAAGSGLRAPRSRLRAICITALLTAGCGGGGWVETYPDIAAQARREPLQFVESAYRQWDSIEGMWGTYQVRASRGVGSRRVDALVYARRDALITIEALAPTGSSEGYVTSGSREIGFWVSEEGRLYRGDITPGAFGRALGLDLEPEDIVAVLLGYAVPRMGSGVDAAWDEGRQRIRVAFGNPAAPTVAWLHPVTARFDRVVIPTETGNIDVTIADWAVQPAPVPRRLRVEVPAEDATLELTLAQAWEANPAGLDTAFFDVEVPSGAVQAPLSLLEIDGGLLRRGFERRP